MYSTKKKKKDYNRLSSTHPHIWHHSEQFLLNEAYVKRVSASDREPADALILLPRQAAIAANFLQSS